MLRQAESQGVAADRVLEIRRVLAAPRQLVFKAWTEPDRLVRWWGPHGFSVPACRLDVRVGGSFRIHMRSAEGNDHWVEGTYREIVPPERLVSTWTWTDADGNPKHETLLTVTLAEHGDGTLLTLHQAVFESVESRDSHRGGWTEALERLAAEVAGH